MEDAPLSLTYTHTLTGFSLSFRQKLNDNNCTMYQVSCDRKRGFRMCAAAATLRKFV